MARAYSTNGLQNGAFAAVDEQQAPDRFDLERWLRLLRRRWWVILSCFVLAAGAAAAYSFTRPKQYTASASLLFSKSQIASALLGTSSSYNPDPARTAETNVKLVYSPGVAELVSRDLGGRPTPLEISQAISASSEGQSDFVAVSATGRSPSFAARLANLYAQDFINYRRAVERDQINQVIGSLQSQLKAMTPQERLSDAGLTLHARITQLMTISDLQAGDAQLVAPASIPLSPSSPKTKLNIAIGGMLGLLLGVGLAVLLERLNRRMRGREEVSQIYGYPVLAELPETDSLARNGRNPDDSPVDQGELQMLRARLRYLGVEEVRSLLVTSCGPREGKTTVAWNLARTTAMSTNRRVLLIEADLRRPTVATLRGLRHSPGLAEVLAGECGYPAVVQNVSANIGTNGTAMHRSFSVIVAGRIPPNPVELLEGERMKELLKLAGEEFDFVIVDSGPALVVPDALALASQVAGVLVVSHVGGTTRDDAARLRDQLNAAHARVVGIVANRVKASPKFDYYYGHSHTPSE
jgi:tyrosine-protein kinase